MSEDDKYLRYKCPDGKIWVLETEYEKIKQENACHINALKYQSQHHIKTSKQNKIMRECLKYYADIRRGLNPEQLINHDSPWYYTSDDYGKKARQALKEIKEM